jgi:hypothetical protein
MVGVEQPEKEETISGIKVILKGEEQLYEDRRLVVTTEIPLQYLFLFEETY